MNCVYIYIVSPIGLFAHKFKEAKKKKSAVDVDMAVTPLAMTRANRPGQPQGPGARVAGNTDPSLQIVIDLDET